MDRHFDQLLNGLKSELLSLGGAVETSIAQAIKALVERDDELAQHVIDDGDRIDDWEVKIEEDCLKLLAIQQPVASDLRLITTTMKVNYDLERINDQAVNIAQRTQRLNSMPLLKPLIDIPRMAELTRSMVRDALDGLVQRKVELAKQVIKRDEEVDFLRDQIFRELLTYMNASSGSDTIDRGIYLILVSRHLERIGDHASNIAENVVFLAEGRIVRHQKEQMGLEADSAHGTG